MKVFIDTANLDEIREASDLGLLDGVTTNPTLLSREVERTGMKPDKILKNICSMVDGPISAEVVSLKANGIVEEGKQLSKIAKNICIKIPMLKEGVKATKKLSNLGIMVNMTLVFSVNQALLAAKAGAYRNGHCQGHSDSFRKLRHIDAGNRCKYKTPFACYRSSPCRSRHINNTFQGNRQNVQTSINRYRNRALPRRLEKSDQLEKSSLSP